MTSIFASLLVALALAEPVAAVPAGPTLDVPYLSQTEALCGGAAVAMVFRYWGDRHADIQQFAPLVDRRSGGIADDVLVDAIRQRGWHAQRLAASIETIRDRLASGQPLILLLEDRPGRYHYVVVVAADAEHIVVHDPALGPSRRLAIEAFLRAWKPSNFWALLVLPPSSPSVASVTPESAPVSARPPTGRPADGSWCGRMLGEAIDEIGRRGLSAADAVLGTVRGQCPEAAGPLAELAGVRFAERRWSEAASLAEKAVHRDPGYEYAWDVLGSSRFMENDVDRALRAWNRIGKPRLDSIDIDGLDYTRYALVAQALALTPNTVLTADRYRLAERRLHQLPTQLSARIGLRPEPDGFATVDVAIVERASRPRGRFEWAASSVQTVVDREVSARIPGWNGEGEVWDVSWRWWTNRPRVAMAFATPRVGRVPGVWRIEASWEAQSYRTSEPLVIREERAHGGVAVTDWISGNLRYEVAAGVDSWDGSRRTASVRGTLERRFLDDRVALSGAMSSWTPLSTGRAFHGASVNAAFRSSKEPRGIVHVAHAGVERVTSAAPLAIWPGAGDGHARPLLLRAHALLRDGVIEGSAFGRRVAALTLESQVWFDRPALARLGLAVFLDTAHAADRLASARGDPLQVDGGLGLRARLPGRAGTLRIDYGRGLRDGSNRLTMGWQY